MTEALGAGGDRDAITRRKFVLGGIFAATVGGAMLLRPRAVGSPVGAVAGALLMGVGQELSVQWVGPSYKIVVSFLVLLAVLLSERTQVLVQTAYLL